MRWQIKFEEKAFASLRKLDRPIRTQIEKYLEDEKKEFFLTLYVTNQCNFKCIYCPEKHNVKRFSNKNWDALYLYLIKSIKEGKYKKISISFFGGEPLLEANQIINFLSKLKEFCKNYSDVILEHYVTTNAFLLTPDIYDKMTSLNVVKFQVSVDGFSDTHEMMRPMKNGKNSWEIIIDNLKYINSVDDNIIICLRTNYNHINLASLSKFKEWEFETFTNDKFKFLYHPVVDFSVNVDESLLGDNLDSVSQEMVDKVNDFKGMHKDETLTPYVIPLGMSCKASQYSTYAMNTEGEISKCENITVPYKEAFIGKLSDDGEFIFFDNAKNWQENYELENCKTCMYYMLCAGRACPAKKVLYPDRTRDCLQYFGETSEKIIKFIKTI